MPGLVRTFLKDRRGASAAEFAMVVLIFTGVIFAIIDFSRALWEWNMAEKATQRGARFAAANDMVAANLQIWDGVVNGGLSAGDSIPIGAITPSPTIVCDAATQCSGGWGWDQAAFDAIVTAMQGLHDGVTAASVTVEYRHIGMGIAGRPDGPDVEPLITIKLTGLQFSFFTPLLAGMTVSMPDFRASLTGEDNTNTPLPPP